MISAAACLRSGTAGYAHPRSLHPGHAGVPDDVWGVLAMCLELCLGFSLGRELRRQVEDLHEAGDEGIQAVAQDLQQRGFKVSMTTLILAGQAAGVIGADHMAQEVRTLSQDAVMQRCSLAL